MPKLKLSKSKAEAGRLVASILALTLQDKEEAVLSEWDFNQIYSMALLCFTGQKKYYPGTLTKVRDAFLAYKCPSRKYWSEVGAEDIYKKQVDIFNQAIEEWNKLVEKAPEFAVCVDDFEVRGEDGNRDD